MDITICRILAIDLRGHGDTATSDDEDLSIERLTRYNNIYNSVLKFSVFF